MFERFTQHARRTIFFARYEASSFQSPYIETQHLLLGLLREDSRLGNELPAGALEAIRKRIEEFSPGRSQVSGSVDLPLDQESQRVLAFAAEESEAMRHKNIDSGHLVLALLRVEGCFARELLREHGIDYVRYRDVVANSVSTEKPPSRQSVRRPLKPAIERPSEWHQPEPLEPLAPSLKPHIRALQELADSTTEHVHAYSEAYASERLKRKPWTRKEAFGHLIDCAASHQRWFAQALTEPKLIASGYPTDEWVSAQRYSEFSWQESVDLWISLNRLLVHVLMRIREDKLQIPCGIGIAELVPLSETNRALRRPLRRYHRANTRARLKTPGYFM